jgi:RAT1-interacting protein
MASTKRALSDVSSDPNDANERVIQKRPRLGHDTSPSSTLHPSLSLSYPDTSHPISRVVPFQRPHPLITFSYDKSRQLEFSDAAMRYYVSPPPDADLAYGYERWIRRPEERGRLDGLLRAILKIQSRGTGHPVVGVISWRGVMTKCVPAILLHPSCFLLSPALSVSENPDGTL